MTLYATHAAHLPQQTQVICFVKDMAAARELSGHSIPQLRQLLVTVFGLLFGSGLSTTAGTAGGTAATAAEAGSANTTSSGPGLASSSSSAGSSIRVQGLLKELRECPLLPLYGRPGTLVPARVSSEDSSGASNAAFFPVEGSGGGAGRAAAAAGGVSSGVKPAKADRCVVAGGVAKTTADTLEFTKLRHHQRLYWRIAISSTCTNWALWMSWHDNGHTLML